MRGSPVWATCQVRSGELSSTTITSTGAGRDSKIAAMSCRMFSDSLYVGRMMEMSSCASSELPALMRLSPVVHAGHRIISTARHTSSTCLPVSANPHGRYKPWRDRRSVTG